ncbi:MAG: class I SAM-dependent methyltransferase [Promethearchaeota archaeon]
MTSLEEFLGNIKNKSILDIGSGSGLFSYSMYLMGAKEITSFDIDLYSVNCTTWLRDRVKRKEKWHVFQGSILDKNFLKKLKKYDIVYAWGVLHHTGNMWEAIKNSSTLVKKNGLLYLAIYNKTKSSPYSLKIKKFYNLLPKIGKLALEYGYFAFSYLIYPIFLLKNPFKVLKNYQKNRGMNPLIDIKDWLGGYPYEVATPQEIIEYVSQLKGNFKLIKIKTFQNYSSNNLYLFARFSE